MMEILVAGIRIDTEGMGRAKQAHVTISYSFTPKRKACTTRSGSV